MLLHPLVFLRRELDPIAVLLVPNELLHNVWAPSAILLEAALASNEFIPIAMLSLPVAFCCKAQFPIAVLLHPVELRHNAK